MNRDQHGIKPEVGSNGLPGIADWKMDEIVSKLKTSKGRKAISVLDKRNLGSGDDRRDSSFRDMQDGVMSMRGLSFSSSIVNEAASMHRNNTLIGNGLRVAESNSGMPKKSGRNITGSLNIVERDIGAREPDPSERSAFGLWSIDMRGDGIEQNKSSMLHGPDGDKAYTVSSSICTGSMLKKQLLRKGKSIRNRMYETKSGSDLGGNLSNNCIFRGKTREQ